MDALLARHFTTVLLLAIAAKLLLAALLPITGDESYFIVWGLHPDLGYYDHPPAVGWWLALALSVGDHPLLLRLPAIIASLLPALGLYLLFRRQDEQQARLLAVLALCLPLFLVGILVTTDTLLILFGLLAVTVFQRALASNRAALFLLAGVLLGLAFLSKYFAALLGIAWAVHVALFARAQWRGLVLVVLGTLPAIALNLYWNQQHCWYNLMFNLVNRHDEGGSAANVPVYLLTLVYLFTPWLLWYLWRQRAAVVAGVRAQQLGVYVTSALVPLAVFLLMAPGAVIGLHWLAVFAPPALAVAFFLDRQALRRSATGMAWLGGVHLALVLALALLPVSLLKEQRRYADAVLYLAPESVAAQFAGYGDDVHFFTGSYSRSGMLTYYSGRYFGVLGAGSDHGRQDDLVTDFRALDGGKVVYLARRDGPAELERLRPFFRELRARRVEVEGAMFTLLEGEGFDYAAYRAQVLQPVRERYYAFPDWLPAGRCGFTERYFTP